MYFYYMHAALYRTPTFCPFGGYYLLGFLKLPKTDLKFTDVINTDILSCSFSVLRCATISSTTISSTTNPSKIFGESVLGLEATEGQSLL